MRYNWAAKRAASSPPVPARISIMADFSSSGSGGISAKVNLRSSSGRRVVICSILIDANYVLVDGSTRRKKTNVKHLEPLPEVLDIKDKASHEEVKTAFEKLGLKVWETK